MRKIGIIICARYQSCGGGKCLRALRERVGGFSIYSPEEEVELVGYSYCGGCPGGNIEYAPAEMKKNGVEIIHFATGFIVGYPPCPYLQYFKKFIEENYGLKVVYGTHPIPEKYLINHKKLKTWEADEWQEITRPTLCDEATRIDYN